MKNNNLERKVLIASPYMSDQNFKKSIVYIFSHTKESVMGIILNQRVGTIMNNDIFKDANIFANNEFEKLNILFGGPINTDSIIAIAQNSIDNSISLYLDVKSFVRDALKGSNNINDFNFVRGITSLEESQIYKSIKEGEWLLSEEIPANLLLSKDDTDDSKWEYLIKKHFDFTNFNMLVRQPGNA